MTEKVNMMKALAESTDFDHLQPDSSSLVIKEIIQSILRDKVEGFRSSFPFSFKFLFTDETGTISFSLDNSSQSSSKAMQSQAGVGLNLNSEKAGTNAISLAMERKDEIYVFGNEPFLQQRWVGWSGFAIPLFQLNKEVMGYFALFAKLESIDLNTYPFIKMMASLLESEINTRLNKWGEANFPEYLAKQLERFNLTPREQQIAALWMMDYEHKKIGQLMGISENTVRVMTTRLNSKLKVHSKASLILRVLGAI